MKIEETSPVSGSTGVASAFSASIESFGANVTRIGSFGIVAVSLLIWRLGHPVAEPAALEHEGQARLVLISRILQVRTETPRRRGSHAIDEIDGERELRLPAAQRAVKGLVVAGSSTIRV
jgi:hypothetical protein